MESDAKIEIEKRLFDMNKKILELSNHLIVDKRKINEDKLMMENESVLLMSEIASEIDENKKPKFSNDIKRKAEFGNRYVGSKIESMKKQINSEEEKLQFEMNEISFLNREIKIWDIVTRK